MKGAAIVALLLLAGQARADEIYRWIWRERAELRADRAPAPVSVAVRVERHRPPRPPEPRNRVEAREAERRRAWAIIAQRAIDRARACPPLPKRIPLGTPAPARPERP